MKMISTNYRATSVYIAICTVLIYVVTAAEQHQTGSETGRSSNHDAFVTIDNILMDEDDQLSTNNPCLIHYCAKGRECVVNPKGLPECVCQRYCANRKKPICGTNGMIYKNHCELHRAACILERPITLQRLDKCTTGKKKPKKYDKYKTNDQPISDTYTTKSSESTDETTTPFAAQPMRSYSDSVPQQPVFHLKQSPYIDEIQFENSPNEIDTGTTSYTHKGYCSSQEYEIMKDNLLLYSHNRLMSSDNNHSKDFLVSIMFSHYDQNNNQFLDEDELRHITVVEHLENLSNGCILSDMLIFDDSNNDRKLSTDEFYQAFNKLYSLSVVSLDKALETNHLSARVGDNVEIKCDVTGSPVPIPIIWKRYSTDLTMLSEDEVRVFNDGSLYLTRIQLINSGNYSCHAERNKDVVQTHILTVHTVPEVHVIPRLQSRRPGETSEMFCHVSGEPFPVVNWLKNDEPLHSDQPYKYEIIGNGTSLKVHNISFSDTGAYMCQGSNIGGTFRDISSLIVQDEPTPTVLYEERKFFVFHEYGIAVYEPSACRLHHQIHSTDVIPGTQEYVCGDKGVPCSWGRSINVGNSYIYVTQPLRDRVLVISTIQIVVVDAITTDKYPVNLYYVPHLDHVWVINWRSTYDTDSKTIQVIRNASQKQKHHTVHPEPIDGQFDLVKNLFLPSSDDEQPKSIYKYGYVTHRNQRGLYKLDLANLRYTKSVDLTLYNCVPDDIEFSSLYGFVIMSCREPITGRHQGQLLLDYLTDTVLSAKPEITGKPRISPDSRHLISVDHSSDGVTIVIQKITPYGLEFSFDVKTTLNISDVTFFESQTEHGYDLYASAVDKEDILYLNLFTGKVEMITGVGLATMQPSLMKWNNPIRPIRSSGLFGQYMVTPANNALFVINGKARTVNCEIGGVLHPIAVVWTSSKHETSTGYAYSTVNTTNVNDVQRNERKN
ncbi:follistatin-related protein 5-like isoform X2 [Bradysia coprophila]|uniref:follistatin-related protein 5-like isoform X2 n=1 Tax=Bradysia coprophila TaxID=38358 RepID=UPI00187DC37F|nr:follistatin-related protein 5-like isoform X2 [Bradysia coprophila]